MSGSRGTFKAVYQSLDCTMESKLLVPVLVRLGLFLIIPMIHWSFHRLVEHGIAKAEKLEAFERLAKRFRYLPDIVMILALVAFHYCESFTEN